MSEVPPADQAPPEAPARERGARRAAIRRWVKRGVLCVAAIVAVDHRHSVHCGPRPYLSRRPLAHARRRTRRHEIPEAAAAHRPHLRVRLAGKFAFDDVVIEGPTARSPAVLPGEAHHRAHSVVDLLRRDLYLDVTLKNWRMVVENWPDGAHLPNLKHERRRRAIKNQAALRGSLRERRRVHLRRPRHNWSVIGRT